MREKTRVSTVTVLIGVLLSTTASISYVQTAFAFLNEEIYDYPGIEVFEDCYNGIDDDGDSLIDRADSLDCY
jgi:hypothetical protein